MFNPPVPLWRFFAIDPAIFLPQIIFSQVSHMSGSFSRRIDLAMFRVGTMFSYRAENHDFSSAGRAPT